MNPKNVNIPTLSGKPSFTQNVTNAKPNEQPNINDDINRLISEDIFPFNYFHGQIYNHSTTLTSMGSIVNELKPSIDVPLDCIMCKELT